MAKKSLKFDKVMAEYAAGRLTSGSTGHRVLSKRQAIAIAYSEQKRVNQANAAKKEQTNGGI